MSSTETAAQPEAPRASRPSRPWARIALGVLLSALFLRVWRLDAIQFAGEQMDAIALTTKSLLEGGASHGLRVSVGLDMPPFFLWLLSLPVLVTQDPILLTAFVAVVNLAGLLGLFLCVRRFVDAHTAWVATILTAASPWAAVFARKIWAQDFIFPFVIAFLAAFFALQERYGRMRLWVCLLVFSLLEQLYPATWFLIPPLAAYLWIFKLRVPRRDLLVGLAIAAVPWIPYVVYQVSIGFDDVLYAWYLHSSSGGGEAAYARDPWAHFVGALRLAGGTGFEYLLGEGGLASWQEPRWVAAASTLSWVFLALCAAAVVHAVAWSALRIRAARKGLDVPLCDRFVVLLALVFVGLLVVYSVLRLPALPHYHVIFLPAVMPLVAWSIVRAAQKLGQRGYAVALAVTVLFALAHEVQWSSFVAYTAVDGNKVEGTYGPPYCVRPDKFDAELAEVLDEARHGDARRALEQAKLLAAFEASHDVLLAFDPARNVPPIEALGSRLSPGEDGGLAVRVHSNTQMIELPAFEYPSEGGAMAKVELTSPVDAVLQVFYQTRADPQYKRGQRYDVRVPAGRRTYCIPLDAPGMFGRLRMRAGSYRYVLHALEVRRVGA